MNTDRRRVILYALVVLGAPGVVQPLWAQQPRLSPSAIGQIVDEVLEHTIPADKEFNGVKASQRPILLDHGRTLAAFGYSREDSVPPGHLRIHRSVQQGSKSVLEDCDMWLRAGQCRRLGWGIYVWLQPRSITDSTALVNVHVSWAARPPGSFRAGEVPSGRAALYGYVAEIHLDRTPDGRWRYVKTGWSAT